MGLQSFEVAPSERFLGVDLAGACAPIDGAWSGWIESAKARHKALLLRNSHCVSTQDFQELLDLLCPDRMAYSYASTPRSAVGGQVYTSTEYPPQQSIPLHNELAYAQRWPRTLWFFCETPAEKGGATPVADSHKIYQSLDPAIVARFAQKGVRYVRNYNTGVDLSWQKAFGVNNRSEVELACVHQGLQWEWLGEEQLRTWQVCPAIAVDPASEERSWFNQAHLFHPSSLQPELREALESIFAPEDLPRNALYGDGTPIEDSVLEEIRGVYQRHQVPIRWQAGDVAILDNRGVAHGREPFCGNRRVLVAMQGEELSPPVGS